MEDILKRYESLHPNNLKIVFRRLKNHKKVIKRADIYFENELTEILLLNDDSKNNIESLKNLITNYLQDSSIIAIDTNHKLVNNYDKEQYRILNTNKKLLTVASHDIDNDLPNFKKEVEQYRIVGFLKHAKELIETQQVKNLHIFIDGRCNKNSFLIYKPDIGIDNTDNVSNCLSFQARRIIPSHYAAITPDDLMIAKKIINYYLDKNKDKLVDINIYPNVNNINIFDNYIMSFSDGDILVDDDDLIKKIKPIRNKAYNILKRKRGY